MGCITQIADFTFCINTHCHILYVHVHTRPIRLATMKLTSTICLLCLISQTIANKSFFLNTSHKTRKNGVVKRDNNAFERKLLVLPTLLKKFLNGRRKFDTVDGIIGDFLFGMAPSDSPSMAPSDAPSGAPSDSPSESPTAVPSAAPFSWNDVLGSDSSNFKTCPSNAMPINYTTNTELNILYSYNLELEPNAHLFKTLEKVEALLEEKLLDDICTTTLDVVSISSNPSDIPGGKLLLQICLTSTRAQVSNSLTSFLPIQNVSILWKQNGLLCHCRTLSTIDRRRFNSRCKYGLLPILRNNTSVYNVRRYHGTNTASCIHSKHFSSQFLSVSTHTIRESRYQ